MKPSVVWKVYETVMLSGIVKGIDGKEYKVPGTVAGSGVAVGSAWYFDLGACHEECMRRNAAAAARRIYVPKAVHHD